MFRDCYFEYAGISSQPYGLIMCYVGNSNEDFDSGGKFELKTDTLPRSHETLLYGKDYSAEPLSFEVEIVSLDDYIPLEKVTEIKNWLFGQDGWKTLRLSDERQNYHLKCIFQPGEDIVDGIGYRGVRCTLVNVSPFWYGEERTITLGNATLIANTTLSFGMWFSAFEINIPTDDSADTIIFPRVVFNIDKTLQGGWSNVDIFSISSTPANSISEALEKDNSTDAWIHPDNSSVVFNASFVGEMGQQDAVDIITVNTKYATLKSNKYPNQRIDPIVDTDNNPVPLFRLHKGKNICRTRYPWNLASIEIKYTPVYRIGAF